MTQSPTPQGDDLKGIMLDRLKAMLRKPKQAVKEKKPANKLWIAYLGFNGTMAFLDLISGVTVGMLTNALYGVLTFLAGFLALLLHENLFTNAHAKMHQKWIAIGGGALAIASTLGIGILASIVNVTQFASLIPSTTLEIAMIASLVVIATIHGLLWGVYFFTDAGHIAAMNRLVNQAFREQQKQDLADAKDDVVEVKKIGDELNSMDEGTRQLVELAYQENTGNSLSPIQSDVAVDPSKGFVRKASETESPQLGENFRPE